MIGCSLGQDTHILQYEYGSQVNIFRLSVCRCFYKKQIFITQKSFTLQKCVVHIMLMMAT